MCHVGVRNDGDMMHMIETCCVQLIEIRHMNEDFLTVFDIFQTHSRHIAEL